MRVLDKKQLTQLLEQVSSGEVSPEQASRRLETLPFERLTSGRPDHHRAVRRGFPEVVYGKGKSPAQVAELFNSLSREHEIVLGTRITQEQAEAALLVTPEAVYDAEARVLYKAPEQIENRGRGRITVLAAGSSDLPAAREALLTSRLMGNETELLLDVGIAGLQRLLAVLDHIRQSEVLIVVAGMEGALPSVVGGLCDRPIVALPTSTGYGTGSGGLSAILSMLNSCVAGISVVNVDNGFGAGYSAALINRRRDQRPETPSFFSMNQD
jgi:NCAIR mutase (PurE)-related protein